MAGKPAKTTLDVLIRSPDYQRAPPFARAKMVRDVLKKTRQVARNSMMVAYPELIQKRVRKRVEEIQAR